MGDLIADIHLLQLWLNGHVTGEEATSTPSSAASDLTAGGAGPTVHIHWCVDQQEKELGCPGRQRRRPESSRLVTHVEGEEVVDRIGPADEGLPISSNMLFAAVHGLASQLG
nr:uncharacterized protein LOC127326227 isoform X1 [Lolium perenne]